MLTSNAPTLGPAYADQAAHDFRVNADDPDYRVRTKAGGSWQWAARDAARRVRRQAGTAIGP